MKWLLTLKCSISIISLLAVSACDRSSISTIPMKPSDTSSPDAGTPETVRKSPGSIKVKGLSSYVSGNSIALVIAGPDAEAYRYKVGPKLIVDCSSLSDYSVAAAMGDVLLIDVSNLSNGTIKLCIITKSKNGTWQSAEEATSFEFERDTLAPMVTFANDTIITNSAVKLTPNLDDAVAVQWKKESGPGTLTFSSSTSSAPTVSASIDGEYKIKLTARDAAENEATKTITLIWDTTPPPALDAFIGASGSEWRQVEISLTLPPDVSDYSAIKLYRSAASANPGVTAPVCGNGQIVTTFNHFSASPLTITDHTPKGGMYYSYTACISDEAGNIKAIDIVDIQSPSKPGNNRHYLAENFDGSDSVTGDIGTINTSTWKDLSANMDATLHNLNFNTADSGWNGIGSPDNPYSLKLDGIDDRISLGSRSWMSYSIWFKSHNRSSAGTLISRENGSSVLTVRPESIFFRWSSVSSYEGRYIPYSGTDWTHLVLTGHGANGLHIYLNGSLITHMDSGSLTGTSPVHLGFYEPDGTHYFDGEIAEFETFSTSLSSNDVRHMYDQGVARIQTDPGILTVNQITGLAGRSDGSDELIFRGRNLSAVSSIHFGNQSALSFEVVNDTFIIAKPPANTSGDVSITDGTTQLSYPNIYRPYDIAVIPYFSFDPGNINRLGENANGSELLSWQSLNNGAEAVLMNFSSAYDPVGGSGWTGEGTATSPYRLEFDGIDDRVFIGNVGNLRGISVWFKSHVIDNTIRYIIHGSEVGDTYGYVQNDTLYCRYNSNTAAGTRSAPITNDEWHHLAIFHDGVDAHCFLNGAEMGTPMAGATKAMARSTIRVGNNDDDFDNSFDGEIGQISIFNFDVGTADIETLFNTDKAKYMTH